MSSRGKPIRLSLSKLFAMVSRSVCSPTASLSEKLAVSLGAISFLMGLIDQLGVRCPELPSLSARLKSYNFDEELFAKVCEVLSTCIGLVMGAHLREVEVGISSMSELELEV